MPDDSDHYQWTFTDTKKKERPPAMDEVLQQYGRITGRVSHTLEINSECKFRKYVQSTSSKMEDIRFGHHTGSINQTDIRRKTD